MNKIAIVGGSGLTKLSGLEVIDKIESATPWGEPSAPITFGKINNLEILFLPRHGNPHTIPPHKINYRANLWALHKHKVSEIIAINAASKKLNNHRLPDCDLYVTLEPCHMCAKAIVDARINNVYFATKEPKNGSIVSRDHFFEKEHLNHRVSYFSGLMQEEASELLQSFFQTLRD
jgi:tRNA(Arg) A34 adenosine deaminase TadA